MSEKCPDCGARGMREDTFDGRVCYLMAEGPQKLLMHFPDDEDCLRRQIAALKEKLPKTADGVAVGNGARVWLVVKGHAYHRTVDLQASIRGWPTVPVHGCYSTRCKAAQAKGD